MEDMIFYDRVQFAFTVTFHYLFPQLTMGLSLIIVYFKGMYLWKDDSVYNDVANFFMKIFAINFTMGVITGIPMEFQFGTNWSRFSEKTGNVIGQVLAMEGIFAFFLESSFLALFVFGEKLMTKRQHFATGVLLFLGSWISGWFILSTNSWMQHPVGYELLENGKFVLTDFVEMFTNPWLLPAFLHNQLASIVTSSFVVASIGAFYMLNKKYSKHAKVILKTGVIFGCIASHLLAFPSGDLNAKNVAKHQPVAFAAMEGLFESTDGGTEIAILGQPNMVDRKLDNELAVPNLLSFLTYQQWNKPIPGLDQFPEEEWPDNIPALYYSYHIMVGLGTIFIAVMSLALFLLWRKKLYTNRKLLWVIFFLFPFPYIANITGWYTAELGRQPYLVYGLLKTSEGASPTVSSGNTLFTLLGFIGLYILLGLLFLTMVGKAVYEGPEDHH